MARAESGMAKVFASAPTLWGLWLSAMWSDKPSRAAMALRFASTACLG